MGSFGSATTGKQGGGGGKENKISVFFFIKTHSFHFCSLNESHIDNLVGKSVGCSNPSSQNDSLSIQMSWGLIYTTL